MSFYNNLEELCKKKKITLAALARELGLSNSATTYWKRGSIPKYETLKKIADYFETTIEELLNLSDSEKMNISSAVYQLTTRAGKEPEEASKMIMERQIINMEIDKLVEAERQMDSLIVSSFKDIPDDLLKKYILRSYGKLNRRGRIEAHLQISRLLVFPQYRKEEK